MFDIADLEAQWVAFDAAPDGYDDVEPPVDQWAAAMTITDRTRDLSRSIGSLASAIQAAAPTASDADLVGWLTWLSEADNRLPTADHAVVAELDSRNTAEAYLYSSAARMLTGELNVRPAAAKARVLAARQMGARRSFTGEELPPLRRHVAAAQAAGSISSDHAQVIASTLAGVSDRVDPELVVEAEGILVELAEQVDPQTLARAGRQALERLDPDGAEPRDDELQRRRGVDLQGQGDGSGRIRGDLTPELFAALQTLLSPLAAPRPTDDVGGPDRRSPRMRNHDALEDVCHRLLRSGTLPDSSGTPTSVVVTMTLEQLEARAGLAMTQFGGTMAINRLLKYLGECEFIPVVLAAGGGVLAYGRTRRIATPGQTKALIARDKGCVIPGCTVPADWCERHHVVPVVDGGLTDVDNLVLACRFHHRNFERTGWAIIMAAGRPWCRPPALLDPDRRLLRNTHWDAYEPPSGS